MSKISTIQKLTEEFQTKITSLSSSLENPSADEQKEFKKHVREFMKAFVPKLEKEIMEASVSISDDEDSGKDKTYSKKELDAMKITDLRKLAKDTFKLTISARTKKAEYVEQILKKQSSSSKKSPRSPKNESKAKYEEEVEEVHPYEVIEKNGFFVDKETKKFVFDPKTKTVVGLLEKDKLKPLRKLDVKALEKKKIRMYHTDISKREEILKVSEIEEILKDDSSEEIIMQESEEDESELKEIDTSEKDEIVIHEESENEDDGSEDGKEIYLPENAFEEKDITKTFKNSLKDILQSEEVVEKSSSKQEEEKRKIIPNLNKTPPKSTTATPKSSVVVTKEDYIAFRERKQMSKAMYAEIIRNNDKYKKQFGFEDE